MLPKRESMEMLDAQGVIATNGAILAFGISIHNLCAGLN
jgi:hypothetical protein